MRKKKILESDENVLTEVFYGKIEFSQIKYCRVNCQLVQNTSYRKVKSFSRFERLQINIQTDLAFLLQHPLRHPKISFLLHIIKAHPRASGKFLPPNFNVCISTWQVSFHTSLGPFQNFQNNLPSCHSSIFPTLGSNSHSSSFPLTFLLLKFRRLTLSVYLKYFS